MIAHRAVTGLLQDDFARLILVIERHADKDALLRCSQRDVLDLGALFQRAEQGSFHALPLEFRVNVDVAAHLAVFVDIKDRAIADRVSGFGLDEKSVLFRVETFVIPIHFPGLQA